MLYADNDPLNRTSQEHYDRFIASYFWGCKEGHRLRTEYTLNIERSADGKERLPAQHFQDWTIEAERPVPFFIHTHSDRSVMNAFLDCYIHTKLCPRCLPVHKLTCKEGYFLLEERDSAAERRFASSDGFNTVAGTPRLADDKGLYTAIAAQKRFLEHRNSCPICVTKPPLGRYTIAAWNAQAAAALRFA